MQDIRANYCADTGAHHAYFDLRVKGYFFYRVSRDVGGEDFQVSGVFVHFHTRSISAWCGDSQGAIFGEFLLKIFGGFLREIIWAEGKLVENLVGIFHVVTQYQKRQRSQVEGPAPGLFANHPATSLDYLIRLRFVNTLICDHKPSDL